MYLNVFMINFGKNYFEELVLEKLAVLTLTVIKMKLGKTEIECLFSISFLVNIFEHTAEDIEIRRWLELRTLLNSFVKYVLNASVAIRIAM